MKRALFIGSAVVLVAALLVTVLLPTQGVLASKMAAMTGAGTSGISIQNLSTTQAASVTVDLYPQGGGGPYTVTPSPNPIPAGEKGEVYLPDQAIPDGAYSAVISADAPIAAIARTDWWTDYSAGSYSSAEAGATTVNIPLVVRAYWGQDAEISVQNTDTAADASVDIDVYTMGEVTPIKIVDDDTITKGASKTYRMADYAAQLPGKAEWGGGWIGSAIITANKDVVAQVNINIGGTSAMYAYSGFTAQDTVAYAPLIRNDYWGFTGIQIGNPGDTAANVTIDFIGSTIAGVGGNFQATGSIAAKSSENIYQGGALPSGWSGTIPPANWLGGAKITATGGIQVIVNDAVIEGVVVKSSAAYNAAFAAEGSKSIAIPLVRNKHDVGGLGGWTTGVQVMNIGTGSTNVTITYAGSPTPADTTDTTTIASMQSVTFYQGGGYLEDPSKTLPDSFVGTAVITSDTEDIVVIVNDTNYFTPIGIPGGDAAIFNGIPQ